MPRRRQEVERERREALALCVRAAAVKARNGGSFYGILLRLGSPKPARTYHLAWQQGFELRQHTARGGPKVPELALAELRRTLIDEPMLPLVDAMARAGIKGVQTSTVREALRRSGLTLSDLPGRRTRSQRPGIQVRSTAEALMILGSRYRFIGVEGTKPLFEVDGHGPYTAQELRRIAGGSLKPGEFLEKINEEALR